MNFIVKSMIKFSSFSFPYSTLYIYTFTHLHLFTDYNFTISWNRILNYLLIYLHRAHNVSYQIYKREHRRICEWIIINFLFVGFFFPFFISLYNMMVCLCMPCTLTFQSIWYENIYKYVTIHYYTLIRE